MLFVFITYGDILTFSEIAEQDTIMTTVTSRDIFGETENRFAISCEDEMTEISHNLKATCEDTILNFEGNHTYANTIYVQEKTGEYICSISVSPVSYAGGDEGVELQLKWHDIDGGISPDDVAIPFLSSDSIDDCIDEIAGSFDIRKFCGSAETMFIENVHNMMISAAADITEAWHQDPQIADFLSDMPENSWKDDGFSGMFIPSGEYGERLLSVAKNLLRSRLPNLRSRPHEVDFNHLRGADWVLMMVSSEASNVLPIFNYNVTPLGFRFESEDSEYGKILKFIVWEQQSNENRYQTITADEIEEYLTETR